MKRLLIFLIVALFYSCSYNSLKFKGSKFIDEYRCKIPRPFHNSWKYCCACMGRQNEMVNDASSKTKWRPIIHKHKL